MVPDTSTPESTSARRPLGTQRGRAGVRGDGASPAGEAMARIGRLVATIKAERHADRVVQPIAESAEHDEIVALLRRFVVAREQERQEWEETLRQLKADLAEARAAAQAAQLRNEQEASRHQRDLADLKLLHEHQRSIWNLDRRRLEITIDGLARRRVDKLHRRRAQLAAGVAALVFVCVFGLALAGNTATGEAGAQHRMMQGIRSLSLIDLPCLIGCDRPPEPVLQQGRL